MKLSGALIVSLIAIYSCSDEVPAGKVPSVIQNSLTAKYPGAIDIDWKKNSTGYEADFDLSNVDYTVHIDSSGKLTLSKHDIKATDFPAEVTARISADYKEYKIDDAEMIEKDTMTWYQAELDSKGKKDLKLVFLSDGSLAQQLKYIN